LIPFLLLAVLGVGCGPAYRYRPAEIMPKGTTEFGAGFGAAGDTQNNEFGGAEVQAWIRGGASERVEVGGRFWTYTFISAGGAFDLRIQLVRGPVDITLDGSILGGVCCELGEDANVLAAAVGFDTGFSIGKRLGGARGPAIYFSPHYQMSWTLPQEKAWPMLISLPLGLDIPLGEAPIALRPEFVVVGEIGRDGSNAWRVGGGIGVAIQPPSPKQLRARREAKRKAKDASEKDDLEEMRRRYGLDREKKEAPEEEEPPEDGS